MASIPWASACHAADRIKMIARPMSMGGVETRVTWQAEKSAQTREKLLEATLDSLANLGYFETTISTIVDYAGVSRGSIRHHFRSKSEIIAAAIEYLCEKRLEAYHKDLFAQAGDVDSLDYVIDTFWRHLAEREFAAHQELVMASRTDAKLHAVLKPALQSLDARWMNLTLERFPHWRKLGDSLPLAASVGGLLLEGMAYRRIVGVVNDELEVAMLTYLKHRLRRLFDGEETLDA
jgi:AcrR family transcriptional regulator